MTIEKTPNEKRLEAKIESMQKEFDAKEKCFADCIKASTDLFIHSEFMIGYCAKNIRFELKISQPIGSKELGVIVNKLRVDFDRMKAEEAELPPTPGGEK